MIDTALVAVLERVDDLDEDALDKFVLAEEHAFPDDGVEVAGADIVYVEGVTALVDLAMESEHVGVGRDAGMELPLASLIILVSLLLHTFDGIFYAGLGVEGAVYDAECPRTQHGHNGECTVIDGLSQGLVCRRRVGHGGWGGCLKQLSPVTGSLVVGRDGCPVCGVGCQQKSIKIRIWWVEVKSFDELCVQSVGLK